MPYMKLKMLTNIAVHKTSYNALLTSSKSFNQSNLNVRLMSNQSSSSSSKKSFIGGFYDSIKEEINKNKEMKESIKKFREEAEKLEQSESLREARKKYKELGDETGKSSKILREKLDSLSETIKESQLGKKAVELGGDLSKQARTAAENVSKQTQELSKTAAFKKVSENVKAIKDNIDEATQLSEVRPYRRPLKLRKRSELDETASRTVYTANTEATGVVQHKDSIWYQSWQNFKENNTYVNKLFDIKTQYEESDNPVVRVTRALTDKFTSMFGGMFKSTEMSEVLTEIARVEPTFELNDFLKRVQHDIIPNILEALSQSELEILKDWCTETAYTILTTPLVQCQNLKMTYNNQVLDISNLEIAGAKMIDNGPVLILSFTAQQILYVTNSEGRVIEGDKDKIMRINHVWVLCRDQSIMDPDSAWRLMECANFQSEMFV